MCAIPLSFRFSLDFVYFPSILVLSREKRARKGITYMKKLITIILALIMMFFSAPNQGADQPHVTAVKTPQTAIITQVEQVSEESETTTETAFVAEVSETETAVETEEPTVTESETATKEIEVFTEEKTPTEQETETEECTEIAEETIITDSEEETVECIDEGDQSLAEYKPQIGDQPNPFENDAPTEIDDRPVEDYVGEGEDRPGEGKHF
jgi:hypothetical protein